MLTTRASARPHPLLRALYFAATYATLMPAHDLCDHVVGQTDDQAAGKAPHDELCELDHAGLSCSAASWRAMAGHVGSYHAVQVSGLLALRRFGIRPSWKRTAAAVALSAATHAFLDRRWPVRWILDNTGSPNFARMTGPICGGYQADQALHHAVLALCAAIIAHGAPREARRG